MRVMRRRKLRWGILLGLLIGLAVALYVGARLDVSWARETKNVETSTIDRSKEAEQSDGEK